MKVSLNTIKQYLDFELPPVDELVARINAQLGGVEEVIDLAAKYKDARIVRVVECEKHTNADKLNVCKIDAGEGELVQVVCGAPNVHADMWAVWLPPQSTVPSTFDDDEPFVLGARELRGVMSNGMLASAKELAIGDSHDGIVEITDTDVPESKTLQAGASFAQVFGLDDTIIDIENKMFTHRPDLFGQLGVAREISAIIKGLRHEDEDTADTRFVNPDWYWTLPKFESAEGLKLEVFNQAEDKVARIMVACMSDVVIKPSPLWLQCALVAMGGKPINNIVDATNYVMLLTAQPTHAYDYDKIRGAKIGARMARDGEKITLLNGKTYELTSDDIVIADAEGPIGLGGIMGGGDSEVDENTTNIVLEVATFDMYAARKSSMRHGIFTDALTRFNKGQSRLQNDRIIHRLIEIIGDISPAKQASNVFDLPDKSGELDEVSLSGELQISADFVNTRLGTKLTIDQIGDLLRRANFASYPPDDAQDSLLVTAPFWRTDIELPEDIVEEVGRLYGFDKLPRELPTRSTKPAPKNPLRVAKQAIRKSLARSGANEVLTYSFVHENVMKKSEQDVSQAFSLSNALSPDLQYYRLSLLPSLLDKIHGNIRAGHDEFALFEIGKFHNKKYHADDDNGLPKESEGVDIVYASKKPREGAAFYHVRALIDQLAHDMGFACVYKPIDEPMDYPLTAPYDQSRSALIASVDGTFIGIVGELKVSVARAFKLPQYVAAASLDTQGLQEASKPTGAYRPLSRYPSVARDISLKAADSVTHASLDEAVRVALETVVKDHVVEVSSQSIYQPKPSDNTKTMTFHITITSHSGTLTDEQVNQWVTAAVEQIKQSIDVEQV